MSHLRDLLNRARWRDAGLHALEVHVLHRGAPGDRRVIAGGRITAARSGGIELAPETEGADPIFVPYHRFLAVFGPDGVPVWSKDGGAAAGPVEVTPRPAATEAPVPPIDIGARRDSDGIVLDGAAGEGGGQILRTALTLSAATGTPFVLDRIRAGRRKPGLMRQHLSCVKAAAAICGADIEGAELGSSRLAFRPGQVIARDHEVDIGSAGSVSLVLQTIALPLALAAKGPVTLVVRGGTHALWAPPYPFLQKAWLPLMARAGANLALELVTCGFHPAGGGEVVMNVGPSGPLRDLHLGDASGILAPLELRAIVAGLPEGIARRELGAVAAALVDTPHSLASETVRSAGPGNAIWLVARDEGTGVTNVFSGIGDVGVAAEDVGRDVANAFLAWRQSGAAIEGHLADQVMLPIALAGRGSFTTSELTLHAQTNIEVIHAFTGLRLAAWDLGDSRFRIAATGPEPRVEVSEIGAR